MSCLGGGPFGGGSGTPGFGGGTGLPGEGWDGITLNIRPDEADDTSTTRRSEPVNGFSVGLAEIGGKFDRQIWAIAATILRVGNTVTVDAGQNVIVETSSLAGPLSTHRWFFTALAWPLDKNGELAPIWAGKNYFEPTRFYAETGGSGRPSFLLRATGGPSEYGFRWFFRIPNQSTTHGNNSGATLSIYKRRELR
jgi:hypothetical protein